MINLFKNKDINKYIIKLVKGKHLLYKSIYTLSLVKLKTLKTNNKTYLKIGFIWLSKSSIDILILFDKKPNSNLCLYINYQGLNNFTIKN